MTVGATDLRGGDSVTNLYVPWDLNWAGELWQDISAGF